MYTMESKDELVFVYNTNTIFVHILSSNTPYCLQLMFHATNEILMTKTSQKYMFFF